MLTGLQEQRHFPGEELSHGMEDSRRPVDGGDGAQGAIAPSPEQGSIYHTNIC